MANYTSAHPGRRHVSSVRPSQRQTGKDDCSIAYRIVRQLQGKTNIARKANHTKSGLITLQ